jgi:hypothetical protein
MQDISLNDETMTRCGIKLWAIGCSRLMGDDSVCSSGRCRGDWESDHWLLHETIPLILYAQEATPCVIHSILNYYKLTK